MKNSTSCSGFIPFLVSRDRCFIGRSVVVLDVLSMIQCGTSDGKGETEREMSLPGCSDGELSIYNSQSCLMGRV